MLDKYDLLCLRMPGIVVYITCGAYVNSVAVICRPL